MLVYKHRHGEDVTVHANPDSAEKQAYKYMRYWLEEVAPGRRPAIRAAIRGKKLREACTLWSEATSDAFGWCEEFELHENMKVLP